MQRAASTVYLLLDMFYFANQYDVSCDFVWLVTALLVCWIMAIATPPIPGGGTVVLTMLFAQLGIPQEALGIAMAFEVVADFPVTAFDQVGILTTITNVSAELDMLDEDVLRAEIE
jgi:Na+/H+-dicarboxylate symporter